MLTKKRESDLKVNSNGFALFVIGLTLAGFLGGALRLLLNSERAQQKILLEVQKKLPEWNVEADSVELHLAAGAWPGVTVELPKAHAHRQGQCGKPSFDIDIESLKIPVSLWSVLSGRNRIGNVLIGRIDIELLESPCPNVDSGSSGKAAIGAIDTPFKVEDFGLRSIYNEIQDRVEGLVLGEVLVRNPTAPDWSFRVRNLQLNVDSQVEVSGAFSIWKQFPSGELRQEFKLYSTLQGPLLEWELRSSIKEGELKWSGQLDEDGKTFAQRVALKQGPLNDILEMLYKAGVLRSSSQTRRAWLNCEVIQGGSFQTFSSVREVPLHIESCSLDGELGRMHLEPQVFYLEEPHLRNGSLNLKVSDLSLGTLMEILGLSKMPVVFSDLGSWTGRVEALSPSKTTFNGQLKGLKLNVSNKSLRGVEVLSNIKTQGSLEDALLSLHLSEFEILGGSRGGMASLKYDTKAGNGDFDVLFENLLPSNSIQHLLIQGEVAPIHLHLKGQLDNRKIINLAGKFSSKQAEGIGWQLFPVQGSIDQIREEQFKVELLSKNFEWDETFKYSDFISSVLSAFNFNIGEKKLADVEVNLDIQSRKGRVTKATALLQEKKVEFLGEWQRGSALQGKVRIGQRAGKKNQWLPVEINHLRGQVSNL